MDYVVNSLAITGANGFIGRALQSALTLQAKSFRSIVRSNGKKDDVAVGDIGPNTDWASALEGMDCVVHLAARVHIMDEMGSETLAAYRKVNVDGTLNLARQAADAGVKRFIFLSTIKVNGESTEPGRPFCANSPIDPVGPYALSKLEAEQGLHALASETGMDITIIRPPLVYGLGVKANFQKMMIWLNKGMPLPFGAIHNKRSLVGLDNLVDLIITCIEHPAAANQVFLVSDDEDLSTTELLTRTASVLGKQARLVPVPQSMLEFILNVIGKEELSQRLCGSLQVDISKTREMLGWSPPVSVDEELHKTAEAFLKGMT